MTIVLENVENLDLRAWIRSGDGLVWGQACAEPTSLTARLMAQAEEIGPLSAFIGATYADAVDLEAAPRLRLTSYCASGRNREWRAAGALDVLPTHYSQLPGLFRRKMLPADVVMLSVGPADADGRYPLGLAAEYLSGALEVARVVLAEVSPHTPSIPDGQSLAATDIDVLVHSNRRPVEVPTAEPTAVEAALAAQVARLVPDGATLQIGLGSFPAAVLGALGDRNDLGVHSGLITDGVVDLVDRGVITNARKPQDRGLTVTGVAMGTRRLFAWLDDNRAVALRDTGYTHDPAVLALMPALTAINSAIEVDLTGQVNTEVAAGRYVGAIGGVLDFLRGAHRSSGGLPIVALPSTARGRSRIVSTLSGPATIGRADVGIVVTEHGAADLRGLCLAERRERLIAIADPSYREELAFESSGTVR